MTTFAQQGRLRFGVNYTPSKHWFHSWYAMDLDATRRDLAQIAALGVDHIRAFCLWPVFQPNATFVNPRAVDDLRALVDAAADAGLDVTVDAIQGHLSSFDFYPSWTLTWHESNLFTDPRVRAAKVRYLRALGAALADRPNVVGYQLGNELNNLVQHNPASPGQIDEYLDELLAAATEALPDRLVTHSAYDAAFYTDGHPFTPQQSARKGGMTTIHPWVFSYDCARRYGPLSVAATHLGEYLVELAKAYATDPHRPVWVQEAGAPQPHVPAGDAAAFTEATIRNIATCTDVPAVTWWCSHDVDRSLADFPELEYTLGLIDTDGTTKPAGQAYADLIREYRAEPPTPAPRTTALVYDGDLDTRSATAPGGTFFDAWMAHAAAGHRLAIVHTDDTHRPDHLAARGITTLTTP
ncbi:glycoside hydrolase 5 family protein [Actinocatenispora rupis]|uniref:Glycoside hydrolase family 5 domain-containing protein n=1 Tax=Actinocatenispora rupis TaxID=519421 RepID=A0A8J3IY12_9ACTN|nr:cellulase family glycosylhydrolase [Actinocatenispora rupis]GID10748.1 hypothetical protein Aru02nite_16370 [Actinocatenispora rupis]